MKSHFAFGKGTIEVQSHDRFVNLEIRGRKTEELTPDTNAIGLALDYPIEQKPLVELAHGKRSATISICDITRPAPNLTTLPPILRRLKEGGIQKEQTVIIIATGLHRRATKDEILALVGARIDSEYTVISHDAHADRDHTWLGYTTNGTPVSIDKRFIDSDLHITCGLIEQQPMLGYSGGRKLIAPGLAAKETIEHIHSSTFMREPLATECSIVHNPLHAELMQIAQMARHDFVVDVTLNRERRISGVFAGDPIKAHVAGVRFLEDKTIENIGHLVDAAITSAAGFPLDMTFYQTIKSVTAAQHIVKPRGSILVISECSEGVGSAEFSRMLNGMQDCQSFLDSVSRSPVEIDQWQLEKLAMTGLRHNLFFYVPGADSRKLGCFKSRSFKDLNDAMGSLSAVLSNGDRIALIPEGPYTIVRTE